MINLFFHCYFLNLNVHRGCNAAAWDGWKSTMQIVMDVKWICFQFKHHRALSLPSQHVFRLFDVMACCDKRITSLLVVAVLNHFREIKDLRLLWDKIDFGFFYKEEKMWIYFYLFSSYLRKDGQQFCNICYCAISMIKVIICFQFRFV